MDNVISVLPFYHRKNVKRLLGKLYFAASVKGISAYALLVLVLYALHASPWVMAAAVILYWVFNMYMSDRVLRAAMDAKPCHHPHVQAAADEIFRKAGISHVRIYETESDDYNGMAVGMNVGRSMVILTSATLTLPLRVIEAFWPMRRFILKNVMYCHHRFCVFSILELSLGLSSCLSSISSTPRPTKLRFGLSLWQSLSCFSSINPFVHNGWRCVLTTLAHPCWRAVTNKWLKL